ncbi:DNA double-strand break repair nuclease NurA [Actinophytocola sp.]|uniref:DNA double-strand break repair nuclease NurA n=1 Tax=Actinophytocola sp. TaxID=1872138 RepID=UPI002ED0CBC8
MTGVLTPISYSVDPWDPGYGVARGDELDGRESSARLDLDVELPASSWRPLTPGDGPLPGSVLFLDGVRRIDARVWVHGDGPEPLPGVIASLAAGLVRCDGAAQLVKVEVDRGLYAESGGDVETRHARYRFHRTLGGLDKLTLGVQARLAALEVELANTWRRESNVEDDLLVVDGPLRGRTHLARTVGYVKTHQKSYLQASQAEVVASLGPGQRSPVFKMGTSWERLSWYLRLPGATRAPWSAIVRLECAADLPAQDAIALADVTAQVLPSLASAPHKDPRAPQNLVPIGGLERQLRHRLGDAALLYRSLRGALAA